jgi:hypothetical protein
VNPLKASDLDRDISPVVQQSWIARLALAPARHVSSAWQYSRTRRSAVTMDNALRQISRVQRVQLVALSGAVSMGVHIALVLLGARAVEVMALVVPAAVLMTCLVLLVITARVSRQPERTG